MTNLTELSIDQLIAELRTATGWPREQVAQALWLRAQKGLSASWYGPNWRSFLDAWFTGKESIFWRSWAILPVEQRAEAIWTVSFFRRLLLLPVEQTIERGLLATDVADAKEWFGRLKFCFDSISANATDGQALRVIELLWKARDGAIRRVSEQWLKVSPSPEMKRAVGQALNELRAHVEAVIEERRAAIQAAAEQAAIARERVDLSLPGIEQPMGSRHVIRQTFAEIERIFLSLGYTVVEGPEIETPYYNFEALNIPEHHPARDNMDTFYLELPPGAPPGLLLRTHTSPMQVRTMERQEPPVRIIVPGRVYRRDNPDATHAFAFHQVEGLAVDEDLTFADFKGTVEYFAREFFGPNVRTRLRPSYFPFTEPSAEVDASCHVCGGSGCRVCKYSGWIEMFGAGMVNPAVYGFVDYDAKRLNGFAFGMGVDRFAMLKYGIDDLQVLFQNDARFLRQFR